MKYLILLVVTVGLAGCASKASNVQAAYVSPLTYQNLDCEQLGLEAERLSSRVSILTGTQNKKRTRDAVATTAAIIVFWPAAFLVGGNDEQTAELAQIKGKFEAIETISIQKKCNLQIKREQPG